MISIPGLLSTVPASKRKDKAAVSDEPQLLEVRRTPAKPASVTMGIDGLLTITGTKKNDVIDITPSDSSSIKVVVNGNSQKFTGVNRLFISTGNGPDSVRTTVNIPTSINTGNGNDSVYALGTEADSVSLGKGRDVAVMGEANVLGKTDNVDLGLGRFNDNVFLNWNDTVSGTEVNDSVQFLDEKPVDGNSGGSIEEILYVDGHLAPDPFEVLFQGDTLSLQQSDIPNVDGVFYKAILNGVDRGLFRANGKIIIQVPGGEFGGKVTIDPALKTFLQSQEPIPGQENGGNGWLEFKAIDSTALPGLPQPLLASTLDTLFTRKAVNDAVLAL